MRLRMGRQRNKPPVTAPEVYSSGGPNRNMATVLSKAPPYNIELIWRLSMNHFPHIELDNDVHLMSA